MADERVGMGKLITQKSGREVDAGRTILIRMGSAGRSFSGLRLHLHLVYITITTQMNRSRWNIGRVEGYSTLFMARLIQISKLFL